eukprot:scaffold25542_cov201-Cylindrotheca_fusiformis.AAC.1
MDDQILPTIQSKGIGGAMLSLILGWGSHAPLDIVHVRNELAPLDIVHVRNELQQHELNERSQTNGPITHLNGDGSMAEVDIDRAVERTLTHKMELSLTNGQLQMDQLLS